MTKGVENKNLCAAVFDPLFFLDVSSRFQYYLWLLDSADSQNMIDCDKPVVMWPNVSVKKIMTRNHIK
jgi:hypothetical protein